MLQLVIFDMDGTVCDTNALMVRAMREAAETVLEKRVPEKAFLDGMVFGANENGILRRIVGEDKAEQAAALYAALYEKYLPFLCPAPFDGMAAIFAFLKQKGIKTALVTGKNRSSCQMTLCAFGMADVFDRIECGSPLGSRKKAGMASVLDALHISPADAVYIGDMPSDVRYAREMGLTALSALWTPDSATAEVLAEQPDAYFRTPSDFLDYLAHEAG